jgi:hypothetical protein
MNKLMLNDTSYHLYIPRHLRILIFGLLTIFIIIGLLMVTGLVHSSKGYGPPRFIGVIWLGMVSWYGYLILSLPHTIIVSEPGQVELISIIRKSQTSLREIESIKPASQFGFFVVRTATGKFRILNQFDGFHDFIVKLKKANPTVELKGC